MYYEERIIDGRLSYRTNPDGKWIPFSSFELTMRLIRVEHELRVLKQKPDSGQYELGVYA